MSRTVAANSSLDKLEQQMQPSGLGLRGDMVAARASLHNDLAKAKQAIAAADTDRARRYPVRPAAIFKSWRLF
ncbi:MAG: hypothetical protein WCC87_13260 [Candidatus Korobacteraceae bacterium]